MLTVHEGIISMETHMQKLEVTKIRWFSLDATKSPCGTLKIHQILFTQTEYKLVSLKIKLSEISQNAYLVS